MSVDEQTKLKLKAVGEITGCFFVPAYQRGYRWGEEQVSILLKDISDNGDKDYCLQPIVVKRQIDGRFELIDGQQRLTTLYLIFLCMKQKQLKNPDPPFSITYETRTLSTDYLRDLDESKKNDNIDFFHIYNAYQCIWKWFDEQSNQQLIADDIYRYLCRYIKVIWYEVSGNVDSTTLFTRLNVGRIPLTNAELVKALLLARKAPTDSYSGQLSQSDGYRQIEIATQWDLIERELHDDGFWAFLTNKPGQEYPTRIEFIFSLMAKSEGAKDRFHTFFYFKDRLDGQSAKDVWTSVLELYYLLKEWFENRDLYHKVGYLVATEVSLAELVEESKGCTKKAFHELLDQRIRDGLKLDEAGIKELSYENHYQKCYRLLLLFNVETVRCLKNSSERYPFHAHKSQSWSLEHIHAQHAEKLNTKEQWQEWLKGHRDALASLKLDSQAEDAKRKSLVNEIEESLGEINKDSFAQLSIQIMDFFNSEGLDGDVHSISNLALLSGGANSALSNSVFQVKRLKIIELDRKGQYIPICTRRVFFKYYTEANDQQMHIWSQQDRHFYLDEMISPERGVLRKYLKVNAEEQP